MAMAFVVGWTAFGLSACSEGKPGHNAFLHRTYGDGLSVNIANVDNEARADRMPSGIVGVSVGRPCSNEWNC